MSERARHDEECLTTVIASQAVEARVSKASSTFYETFIRLGITLEEVDTQSVAESATSICTGNTREGDEDGLSVTSSGACIADSALSWRNAPLWGGPVAEMRGHITEETLEHTDSGRLSVCASLHGTLRAI